MNAKAKSLFSNILPALGVLFVTYLYNVVDGNKQEPSPFQYTGYWLFGTNPV